MMRAHGTRRRYIEGPDENDQPGKGCHCPRCRKAAAQYRARQRIAVIIGAHRPDVDAGQSRQHVVMLRSHGMDVPGIAHAAGLAVNTVKELLYGGKKTVRPKTQTALLAVQPGDLDRPGLVLAFGTRRRLHALSAMGYPASLISQYSGVGRDRLLVIMSSAPPTRVTVATARRINDAYRKLWTIDPAAHGVDPRIIRMLRRKAADKGWASPLAWENIDDPDETPLGISRQVAS